MRKSLLLLAAAPLVLAAGFAAADHRHGGRDARQGPRGGGAQMMRQMFNRADADANGAVTLEEAQAAASALFDSADGNGDGAISRGELVDGRIALREARRAERFARLDADGDGAVTLDEMQAAAEARAVERRRNRVEARFSRLDANADGVIDADELTQGRQGRRARMGGDEGGQSGEGRRGGHGADGEGRHERGEGRRGGMGRRGGRGGFRMADANGDGAVDRSELDALVSAMFERADANEDGAVSRAELAEAAPRGRGRHGGRHHGGWRYGE